MTSVLDAIDAAVGGLCVCGCGRKLDPNGPSAWFVEEWCQRAWQADAGERSDRHNRCLLCEQRISGEQAAICGRCLSPDFTVTLIGTRGSITDRINYFDLATNNRTAHDRLLQWLRDIGLNPDDVPIDGTITVDGKARLVHVVTFQIDSRTGEVAYVGAPPELQRWRTTVSLRAPYPLAPMPNGCGRSARKRLIRKPWWHPLRQIAAVHRRDSRSRGGWLGPIQAELMRTIGLDHVKRARLRRMHTLYSRRRT